jgi:hypothetical protein
LLIGSPARPTALDRAKVEIVPADVTKGARFATKHPIKVTFAATAAVTPQAKMLLGRANTCVDSAGCYLLCCDQTRISFFLKVRV